MYINQKSNVFNNFEGVLIRLVQLQNYLVEFDTYILNVFLVGHKFAWYMIGFTVFSGYWIWNHGCDKSRVL